jgi:DNA-binding transcriptional LysR family regulator
METPDLNLLVTLDVLLAEGSVVGAARRLRLSASAMSRALARLRDAVGDPLLVRQGRGLTPTPRALELRQHVGKLVQDAQTVLRPSAPLDPQRLMRAFTLRTTDGFAESFGPTLIARVQREAPGVQLRFVPKADKDSRLLREGLVDLETGVVTRETGAELRTRALFHDHYIGVVRKGHALSRGKLTPARFADGKHVVFSRYGHARGPIDETLASLELRREVAVIVGGFPTALALARASDLIASVPVRHTGSLRGGMFSFELPFAAPQITISMLWHPRVDADPAHRWLRDCLHQVVGGAHRDAPIGRRRAR